jgi:hypothetical protein
MRYFNPKEPIHVTVSGRSDDPRDRAPDPPGIVVHYSPTLHPDDLDVVRGIPCTSVARTLIDCAEVMSREELVELFREAQIQGVLDIEAVRASRARVEWRPSLAMLDEVIDAFS